MDRKGFSQDVIIYHTIITGSAIIKHKSQVAKVAVLVGTILFQHLFLASEQHPTRLGMGMAVCITVPGPGVPGKARDGVMMVAVARPGGGPAQASSGQRGLASR